jgi:hypothetical protein
MSVKVGQLDTPPPVILADHLEALVLIHFQPRRRVRRDRGIVVPHVLSLFWLTILPFSGGRERERSDRRARPSATAG